MDPKDAYICYNQADFRWVQHLTEQIESETIDGSDSGRTLVAFFDKWDIDAGQSLIDRMNAGMNAARHIVAVLSPEFLKAD
jgi:TIR domain